jgi:hypothetical protein
MVIQDRRFDIVLGHLQRVHDDARIARYEALQQRCGEMLGDRCHADAQRAARQVLHFMNSARAGLQLAQCAPGMMQIDAAGVGEPYVPAGSIEQLNVQCFLQQADLL